MNHKTYISQNLHKKNRFKRCMTCGKHTIDSINLAGRTLPYMNYEITIPVDYQVIVLGCSDETCGNFIFGHNDPELLDSVCRNIIKYNPEHIKTLE